MATRGEHLCVQVKGGRTDVECRQDGLSHGLRWSEGENIGVAVEWRIDARIGVTIEVKSESRLMSESEFDSFACGVRAQPESSGVGI